MGIFNLHFSIYIIDIITEMMRPVINAIFTLKYINLCCKAVSLSSLSPLFISLSVTKDISFSYSPAYFLKWAYLYI